MAMSGVSIALTSLSIRNFRGIECLDLDFRGPDGSPNQLVVLAGPNGCGKTTVLEAAILAAGDFKLITGPRDRRAIRIGAEGYEICARRIVDNREEDVAVGVPGVRPMIQALPVWYFSSWRAPRLIGPVNVTVGKRNEPGSLTRTTVTTTITTPGKANRSSGSKAKQDRLGNLKQQLVNAAARDRFRGEEGPPINRRYDEWIERINANWRRFYPEGGRFFVDLAENEGDDGGAFDVFFESARGNRLEVDFLSSGQIELFIFLTFLGLHENQEGLIFIDEPELHLDPQWHRPIMKCLTSLQPRAQFLVATHSPEIYDAARSYERHYLVPASDPRARLWQPVQPTGLGAR